MTTLHHVNGILACPSCEDKLTRAHPTMREWYGRRKASRPDLHICWSFRNQSEQEEAFLNKKTKLHYPQSKHNRVNEAGAPESDALDLFFIDENGQAVFDVPLRFEEISQESKAEAAPVLWGRDFESHKEDYDHFERVP